MAFETTLPGRYFYDPEIYAREQERLFGQMWTCVGRADALPAAGDFKTVELAGESVLIVRGRDGELRAFLNVCRHRGARLSLEPCGNTGAAIQCMYHAWSYALDGRLIGAPNIARDESLDRETPRTRTGSSRRLGRAHLALAGRRSSSGHGPARAGAARPFRRAGEIPALRRRVAGGRADRSPTRSPRTGSWSSRTSWSATTALRSTPS